MRTTKASLIYRRTKKLRAVQLLLGHTKAGKYRALSWHRGGQFLGDGRANRSLNCPLGCVSQISRDPAIIDMHFTCVK